MNRGVLLALGAAGISGVSVFVNSYGVKAFAAASADATTYTTAKNAVAAAVLVIVLGAARNRDRAVVTRPTRRRDVAGLAAVALVGGSLPFVLFFEGLAHVAAGPVQAQFLNKTLVVWVALLAVTLLGERLGPLQLGAVALLVVGQASLAGGVGRTFTMPFGRGEALILAATVLWAVEVVLAKALLRDVSPPTVMLARMVLGSVLLLGWAVGTGRAAALVAMDARQWGWVLLTGGLLAGYVATWLVALSLAPAVNVTAVLVAAVPVTAVLQSLVQGAPLRPVALSLVVAGCALASMATLARRDRTSVPG